MSEKIKGTVITVSRWAGEQHGHGANICFDPHPNDEVTVWRDFKAVDDPDCFVSCYRFQVEEMDTGVPTLSQNSERLARLVER